MYQNPLCALGGRVMAESKLQSPWACEFSSEYVNMAQHQIGITVDRNITDFIQK